MCRVDRTAGNTGFCGMGSEITLAKAYRHMWEEPCLTGESKRILRYLHDTYGNDICISIMNQYTPQPSVEDHPVLSKKLSDEEYEKVLDFAEKIGIENGFIQQGEAALDSFIPKWDLEGIISSPTPPYT